MPATRHTERDGQGEKRRRWSRRRKVIQNKETIPDYIYILLYYATSVQGRCWCVDVRDMYDKVTVRIQRASSGTAACVIVSLPSSLSIHLSLPTYLPRTPCSPSPALCLVVVASEVEWKRAQPLVSATTCHGILRERARASERERARESERERASERERESERESARKRERETCSI